ncbi:hypothetical protein BT63DRAFT_421257 [Microthyrium microscopicum]|uniref:HypA-like protein n=1 Tax=Microthyrium microscopicum TaxID=703497 RepID=A0A6A6UQ75_9PEZI|nr:hypothetical protein BT63DRAFT_421257 [Microthyrium microscopicum]
MASPSTIDIVGSKPVFGVKSIADGAAKKASELLQENHELHHIFFNDQGFHNHIVHHILSLYALGASPELLKTMYDENANYQRPAMKEEKKVVQAMHDPAKFKECLGDENHYTDYLVFFQDEMTTKGWENVINEYLFADNDLSNDLLVRTFSGFLHPLIHLGFGIEYSQPAIIAEALAEACVHSTWITPLYIKSEELANAHKTTGKSTKSLMAILADMQSDQALIDSTHFDDSNKIRDGILARAPDTMINHASNYFIKDASELSMRTAEMVHFANYFTMAAQRADKHPKVDFFYMHCANSSIFFPRFLELNWLSDASKIRLLEWKARSDLALYASRHVPILDVQEIARYTPKEAVSGDPWARIIERGISCHDDGHSSKLVRALANAKKVCVPWEGKEELGFVVKGDMWDLAGQMAVDSIDVGPRWIRGAGFEEAWADVPGREAKL